MTSRVAALLQRFRSDARSVCLREGEHQVDDVSNTLKRFLRELKEGVFTEEKNVWLTTASQSHNSQSQHTKFSVKSIITDTWTAAVFQFLHV